MSEQEVKGYVKPGYELVRDTFLSNFVEHGERGAAFSVVVEGETVVDLWGGLADEGRPWDAQTLQVIYSGSKALVALCLLMLVDRGKLDLGAPVAQYWPEFSAQGKEGVRVIDLASHRARLPGFQSKVSEDDLIDDREMARLLASQPLDPDPRAGDTYHALTFGWLCGELVRRVDGRSIGAFFAEEVAQPLDLEIWIGLPVGCEHRVSTIEYATEWNQSGRWDIDYLEGDDLLARVWNNPRLFPPDRIPSNRLDWHRAELPAAGGIATARSLARLFCCLAQGGEFDGIRIISNETLELGRHETSRRWEPLVGEDLRFGVGFELQTKDMMLGHPEDAFGHCGSGGSVQCAWPAQRAGLSYVMNSLQDWETDQRAKGLLDAMSELLS